MIFISKVNNCLAKQLMTLVEFCCHGEQINVNGIGFFRKMAKIMGILCNSCRVLFSEHLSNDASRYLQLV